jgi:hypothetical protein
MRLTDVKNDPTSGLEGEHCERQRLFREPRLLGGIDRSAVASSASALLFSNPSRETSPDTMPLSTYSAQ